MPINFSQQVYLHAQRVFGRTAIFTPPGGGTAITGRGIFGTVPIDVMAEDSSIFSDQRTILDILEEEFATVPGQNWRVTIPADSGLPALGDFIVLDADTNGGGETTLSLRKVEAKKP